MDTQNLIVKIFNFLYSGEYEIVVINTNKFLGMIYPDKNKIELSVSKILPADNLPTSPALTLIHEALHEIFPNDPHSKIDELTKKVWGNLKEYQKLSLYEIIFE